MVLAPVWAATVAVWVGRARIVAARMRRPGHVVTSVLLVVVGLAGGLGGGALIGTWCLGVVMIAESALLVVVGMNRDDGAGVPVRGARTVGEILHDEALRP